MVKIVAIQEFQNLLQNAHYKFEDYALLLETYIKLDNQMTKFIWNWSQFRASAIKSMNLLKKKWKPIVPLLVKPDVCI